MIKEGMKRDELRKLRESMNWSQADFADRLGITSNSYARLERGIHYISFPMSRLAKVTVALAREGIDIRQFD